jgi:hypothetical protein
MEDFMSMPNIQISKNKPPPIETHPAYRGDADAHGSRFMNFVYNFLPRSPTKDKFEVIGSTQPQDNKQIGSKPPSEVTSAANPPGSSIYASSTDQEISSHGPISRSETPPLPESRAADSGLNTTPSKAAKVLGLGDVQLAPSKATRILGPGLEGDEELAKVRGGGRRLSSGEFLNASPSRRVARLIEGAASKLSRTRESVELSDVQDVKTEQEIQISSSAKHKDDVDTTPKPHAFRTSSLKYMDDDLVPPTPPDKDTIYGGVRVKSDQQDRPHIRSLFTTTEQKHDNNVTQIPIIKGEKGSLKANLVSMPSIYSLSGVLEESTMRGTRTTMEVDHNQINKASIYHSRAQSNHLSLFYFTNCSFYVVTSLSLIFEPSYSSPFSPLAQQFPPTFASPSSLTLSTVQTLVS